MYQYPPSGHPGFLPQSDGRRLVFPLSPWKGTYKTENFLPSLVDYRCSIDDIKYFFNDIYYSTKRLKPFRVSNRIIIGSFITYFLCFFIGIFIEFTNSENYVYNSEGEVTYTYDELDDSGLLMIMGGMFVLIFVNVAALVYRNKAKTKLFKRIVHVLESHKSFFLQRGLRWGIPENLQWLELWMDYRFFSPYYMQTYVANAPVGALQPQNIQTIASAPVQSAQASQNSTCSINSADKDQTGQKLHQGYPVIELANIRAGPNSAELASAQNSGTNGNRQTLGYPSVGYVQGVPQSYHQGVPQSYPQGVPQSYPQGVPQSYPQGVPQSYPQQPSYGDGYGYYQNQLNESMLGYPNATQEGENVRLARPY